MVRNAFIGITLLSTVCAAAATAQSSNPFGGFKHDRTQPVEITSLSLEVFQDKNLAVFEGDVIASQGTMRLNSSRLEVIFDPDNDSDSESGAIKHMTAIGEVFISNGAETAHGDEAVYNVETGIIDMTGDVVLTQGENVIAGSTLKIDVDAGTGRIEATQGRVTSIFTPRKQDDTPDEDGATETASEN